MNWMTLRPSEPDLVQLNARTQPYGLSLSRSDIRYLIQAQLSALAATGRIEFESGTLSTLADAFCSSPYLSQRSWCDALCELTELFYYIKERTEDRVSDELLIQRMRALFDHPCEGSVQKLADLLEGGLLWPD